MNYQHLYVYLETRPIDELKECMNNVVGLTKKHAAPMDQTFETEDCIILNSDIVLKELRQLRVAQRIWTQEAISGKFGSVGISECLTKPEVISYLANVNGIIDGRMYGIQKDAHSNVLSKSYYVPISPHPSTVDSGLEESCEATKVPSRDINIVTNNIDALHNVVDSPGLGKRKREHGTIFWTLYMDSALLQHVLASEDPEDVDWTEVANHIGQGVTAKKCEKRWKNIVEPQQRGLKKSEEWTDAEVQKLFRLVSQHTTPPVWLKNQQRLSEERIDWAKISQEMGRVTTACRTKWITHRQRTMKGGPFTPAEDTLIRQRVAEWGDKGKGLWVSLEKEMNRSVGALTKRWETLSARVI